MSAVLVLSAPSKAQPPTSAPNPPPSAIPVRTGSSSDRIPPPVQVRTPSDSNRIPDLVNACAAAADELAATRRLTEALERENTALKERLETAARTEVLLKELTETRRAENEALRSTVSAKNETITAKDAGLAKQDELVTELRRRRSSPWKRVGDILIGVAISAVLK